MSKTYLTLFSLVALMINQGHAIPNCATDCCWLSYMLQQFGFPKIDVSQLAPSSQGCCTSYRGYVECSGEKVIGINFANLRQLSGPIPSYISNITALKKINLSGNNLTGEIPSSIRNLQTLAAFNVANNQLSGDATVLNSIPSLTTIVLDGNVALKGMLQSKAENSVHGTEIYFCGGASVNQPLNRFPYPSTLQELRCLASVSASSQPVVSSTSNGPITNAGPTGDLVPPSVRIAKRGVAATFPSVSGTFACSVDPTTSSPYQDCINTIAAFCYTGSPIFSSWSDCQSKIRTIRTVLNLNWKTYIDSCAKFLGGNPTSSACSSATSQLLSKEYYYWRDSANILRTSTIPQSLISAAVFIWNV